MRPDCQSKWTGDDRKGRQLCGGLGAERIYVGLEARKSGLHAAYHEEEGKGRGKRKMVAVSMDAFDRELFTAQYSHVKKGLQTLGFLSPNAQLMVQR